MRSWFYKLLIVCCIFLLSLSFPDNKYNYIVVEFNSWHLRLSVLSAFFIIILLNLLLYYTFKLFYYVFTIFPRINSYRKRKLLEFNKRSIEQGWLFFLENRIVEASEIFSKLVNSDIDIRSKIIVSLSAAKAYFLLGKNDESMKMIRHAEVLSSNSSELIEDLLTLKSSILIDMNLPEEAAECLLKLNDIIDIQYSVILQLSLKVEIMLGNNIKAIDLARLLLYDYDIDKNFLYDVINKSGSELLKDMKNKGLPWKQQWKNFSQNERLLPEIALVSSRAFFSDGDYAESEKLLESVLSKNLNNKLLYEYTKCKPEQISRRLSKVESWIDVYGDDPDLLNTLGILCLHAQLWGQADYYFNKSLGIRDDSQIHVLLSILYKCLNKVEEAISQLLKSLNCNDDLFIPKIINNSYKSSIEVLANDLNNNEMFQYSDKETSKDKQEIDDQYFDSAPLPGLFFNDIDDGKTNKS
ncbi:HemY protein [Candidatus Kinetoplastibacterium oncopeltii TCC290E]|uniref:HemY protein n=1 Tax=Candidatus Kinetoplastidibacterium stringomonadis TCC290E TaxID=1208920 RepID=M1LVX0_9PROT|nr:heme biosynthesis HemY N-terminal domain-containing protein [Candidatus Kinetoplastibacterium oncopeltii]AGF48221.1 HemY protein [Candidatus Kinetoplastibacterium oncopeltii TCC290E]